MKLIIDKGLMDAAPKLKLGVIETGLSEPTGTGDELWEDLTRLGENMCEHITSTEQLGSHPAIEATRSAYKALGKDPSRYRGSAEALMRRLIKGQGLYRVHPIVEINNFISLQTMCPVGSYDRSKLKGNVIFRAGKPGEQYEAIGNKMLNIEGLPIFCDDEEPFGSPTSDSKRSMIQATTTEILTVIIAFDSSALALDEDLKSAEQLFRKYLPVGSINAQII
jgi:DNA/RNA-binding domain of Phe-tRNA-synthetase-like protein